MVYINPTQPLGVSVVCTITLKRKQRILSLSFLTSWGTCGDNSTKQFGTLLSVVLLNYPSILFYGHRPVPLINNPWTTHSSLLKVQFGEDFPRQKENVDRIKVNKHEYTRSEKQVCPSGETPPLWVLRWLLYFIYTGYMKSMFCICTCDFQHQLGSETDHIRATLVH